MTAEISRQRLRLTRARGQQGLVGLWRRSSGSSSSSSSAEYKKGVYTPKEELAKTKNDLSFQRPGGYLIFPYHVALRSSDLSEKYYSPTQRITALTLQLPLLNSGATRVSAFFVRSPRLLSSSPSRRRRSQAPIDAPRCTAKIHERRATAIPFSCDHASSVLIGPCTARARLCNLLAILVVAHMEASNACALAVRQRKGASPIQAFSGFSVRPLTAHYRQ